MSQAGRPTVDELRAVCPDCGWMSEPGSIWRGMGALSQHRREGCDPSPYDAGQVERLAMIDARDRARPQVRNASAVNRRLVKWAKRVGLR